MENPINESKITGSMTPLKRSFHHVMVPQSDYDKSSSLRILTNEVQSLPHYHNLTLYVDVEIRGYNAESILHQILEEQGMERVVELLNDLKTDSEHNWKITILK